MSDRDLFGEPVREEPGYQSARSGPAERMFDFPVTLPGQLALGAPEGASDAMPTTYTPDEAAAYRRMWGQDPSGYTPQAGRDEIERRRVLAHGARHALCAPGVGGDWRCRHATATDKGCGTLYAERAA